MLMPNEAPLGIEKLQQQKLELEIAELRRPTWLKPAMMTPIVAALVSIALGHYTGWFDLQSTKLENQRFELRQDIQRFEGERARSKRQLESMQAQLRTVTAKLDLTQKELSEARRDSLAKAESFVRQVQQLKDTIVTLESGREKAIADQNDEALARIARELEAAEKSLDSAQPEALALINQLRVKFDIPESTLDDWEQKIKADIERTENVDEDGCYISSIDNMQHCLNY